jgi:hypothetical protein
MSEMTVSGPMFEQAESINWKSVECQRCRAGQTGAHYNTFSVRDAQGMAGLRAMFPSGKADSMNVALFSTSGVHGTYTTIEEAEAGWRRGNKDEDGEDWTPHVTFLIIHPRIVCLRYGNCAPQSADDFEFLKRLRASSWQALAEIGRADEHESMSGVHGVVNR